MILDNEKSVKFFTKIVKKMCPLIPEKDEQLVIDSIVERYNSGVDKIYNDGLIQLQKSSIAELISLNYGLNTINVPITSKDDTESSELEDDSEEN